MLGVRHVPCQHCGSPRDPDQTRPCPLCRSRRYPLIGYSFQHEARTLMTMGLVMAGLLLLSVLAGAAVLIYLETQLSAL